MFKQILARCFYVVCKADHKSSWHFELYVRNSTFKEIISKGLAVFVFDPQKVAAY